MKTKIYGVIYPLKVPDSYMEFCKKKALKKSITVAQVIRDLIAEDMTKKK